MALITPAHIVALTDKLAALYLDMLGSSATGLGVGDGTWGVSDKAGDIKALCEGSANAIFADSDLQTVLLNPSVAMNSNLTIAGLYSSSVSGFLSSLDSSCAKARGVDSTILNLDSFMTWYNWLNASTYWQCLAPPDFYDAFVAAKSGTAPTPKNVYYELLQGVTYKGVTFTNALRKYVGTGAGTGTQTAGTAVPSTHAGGFAQLRWSGASGSGNVTATGTDQDGNAETWVGALSGASGTVSMTPQSRAYSLVRTVSGISAVAGVTAGTLYIEAIKPSGRTNPPT